MRALVLCAGFGTRLGNLTRDVPKCMLTANGIPILAYILGHLKNTGFLEIRINLHFQPSKIVSVFGDGKHIGLDIRYYVEPTILGTGGGVRNAAAGWTEPFLVQYGDIVTTDDLNEFMRLHASARTLASMKIHKRVNGVSRVDLDAAGYVTAFRTQPTSSTDAAEEHWVNSSLYALTPRAIETAPLGQFSDLNSSVMQPLIQQRQLTAFPCSGYRLAVDSPERLAKFQDDLNCGRVRIQPCL